MPKESIPFSLIPSYRDAGFRPGGRATFVSAKVAKTMLAVLWPFGFPARFADSGGAQTRYAQTLRAVSPVSAALLDHTTRPGETAEKMSPLIMAEQIAELVLNFAEGLRQGPPDDRSVHPESRTAGVRHREDIEKRRVEALKTIAEEPKIWTNGRTKEMTKNAENVTEYPILLHGLVIGIFLAHSLSKNGTLHLLGAFGTTKTRSLQVY